MKTFPAARYISWNINLPLCSRFCFKGSEINYRDCFLYGHNWRSFLTILCIEDLEIFASFATFLTLLCGFHSIFFFTAETTLLVQIERGMPGIGLPEVVPVSWNCFQALKTVFQHILSCLTMHLLLTLAVLRATIWSRLTLSAITYRIPERNEWNISWTLIDIYRFNGRNFQIPKLNAFGK